MTDYMSIKIKPETYEILSDYADAEHYRSKDEAVSRAVYAARYGREVRRLSHQELENRVVGQHYGTWVNLLDWEGAYPVVEDGVITAVYCDGDIIAGELYDTNTLIVVDDEYMRPARPGEEL